MPKRRKTPREPEPMPVEPWLAAKHDELEAREGVTFVYLLVDDEGAQLIAKGILPDYVQRQARRALDWMLEPTP